jgi:hypothetical protein
MLGRVFAQGLVFSRLPFQIYGLGRIFIVISLQTNKPESTLLLSIYSQEDPEAFLYPSELHSTTMKSSISLSLPLVNQTTQRGSNQGNELKHQRNRFFLGQVKGQSQR